MPIRIYQITSLRDADTAVEWYCLRFRIESMVADHKSRGFQIDKSHLAALDRLGRLLIATSLAYLWVHAVAIFAHDYGWMGLFHRNDRFDLSLFQIGVRAIQYAVREGWRVPASFLLPLDPPAAPQAANDFCTVAKI
jgi:hypothetical protein